MAAKTAEFFGSDARLKIKGISGVNVSVKLSKELAELFGISLMKMKDGGFNAPIIKALSPGIPWTTNEKKLNLHIFVILEYGTIEWYQICLFHFVFEHIYVISILIFLSLQSILSYLTRSAKEEPLVVRTLTLTLTKTERSQKYYDFENYYNL